MPPPPRVHHAQWPPRRLTAPLTCPRPPADMGGRKGGALRRRLTKPHENEYASGGVARGPSPISRVGGPAAKNNRSRRAGTRARACGARRFRGRHQGPRAPIASNGCAWDAGRAGGDGPAARVAAAQGPRFRRQTLTRPGTALFPPAPRSDTLTSAPPMRPREPVPRSPPLRCVALCRGPCGGAARVHAAAPAWRRAAAFGALMRTACAASTAVHQRFDCSAAMDAERHDASVASVAWRGCATAPDGREKPRRPACYAEKRNRRMRADTNFRAKRSRMRKRRLAARRQAPTVAMMMRCRVNHRGMEIHAPSRAWAAAAPARRLGPART